MEFTRDQLAAVDIAARHTDACVVAGPGSGKTAVLVEHFRKLVEAGVDPLRILAITFTEKAAGNMRKRLADAFQDDPARRARLERSWVSTVHGFCARLLRENAVFAGVDPEFRVSDEIEAWHMQHEAIGEAMESVFQEHPAGVRSLIRGLSSWKFEEAVLSAYDAMRGAGVRVEDLAGFAPPEGASVEQIAETLALLRGEPKGAWKIEQRQYIEGVIAGAAEVVSAPDARAGLEAIERFECNRNKCRRAVYAKPLQEQIEDLRYTLITELYAPERRLLLDILRRFDQCYRTRKRQAGVLDFSDLEEFTVRLLEENGETHRRVQAQFEHILMDEFQDTNGQQARLLRLVRAPGRFYAVGDINQSIFGFRHAEPQGFTAYREEIERTGGRLIGLRDNFRSRAPILSAVESILDGAAGIEPRALAAGRIFADERDVCVELLVAQQAGLVEPRLVARRIQELVPASFEYRDVAVLVRNTEVLAEFSAAFEEAGIPYLVNRGRGFYDSRDVNDLTHLLRVIANPRDEVSFAAVLRSPLVAASDEALLWLRLLGANIGPQLTRLAPEHAADFGPDDFGKLSRFRERLREWRERREYVTFDRLLAAAIDDTGYPWSPNVDKFLAQAREAASRLSLDEFVEQVSRLREENPREPDAPPEDSANAVKVMTVHSAKGLEFPVVFVAALHKGIESSPPVVAFSRHFGLGARWRNPARRDDKDDLFQRAIREERKQRELEESHRLLYVAMTRAEELLVLSFTTGERKPQNWAQVVSTRLGIDWETARDEVVDCMAPDGKAWKLRVLVTPEAAPPVARELPAGECEAAELMDIPVSAGSRDGNATVTALAQFAHCPRQYFLERYLGFEGRARRSEPGGEESGLDAAELGTQVHALLGGKPVCDPDPEAVRLAAVFQRSALARRLENASRVEREFDFLMAVEDLVIRGQIDLWFEEGGELVIADYKTDRVRPQEAQRRAQEYGLQLRLYALAVERLTGRAPDRAWLHFLRPDTLVEVDLAPTLLDSPAGIIHDFQAAQSSREFPLQEGEHCHRCPFFRDLCPAGIPAPAPDTPPVAEEARL